MLFPIRNYNNIDHMQHTCANAHARTHANAHAHTRTHANARTQAHTHSHKKLKHLYAFYELKGFLK